MLMKDVCRKCMLTRKAIEYYEEQGLIFPNVLENNYRDFTETDVERLKKIAILRGLGLSVADIRAVFSDGSGEVLRRAAHKKEVAIAEAKAKQILLEKLALGVSWEDIRVEEEAIAKKQTITQKLLNAFPGYYGRAISLHLARFLNEPILSAEQQSAYDIIVDFLDSVNNFVIPADLQTFLDEATGSIGTDTIQQMSENLISAVEDVNKYMADNKETLEQYIAYKSSDEFKQSPAYRWQSLLREFNSTSGYNDVFIPALKRLSKSYCEYQKALAAANEALLSKYPEVEKGNG